jgi:uncharacterized protein YdeI (YjbR/CyaY-like superfamily)
MKKISQRKATLKRAHNPMPRNIKSALKTHGLLASYGARPPYQQNDYLGWISRAKLDATKRKRIQQMLEELKQGNVYMKMRWNPSR